MLANSKNNLRKLEEKVVFNGLSRKYPFYLVGQIEEFLKSSRIKLKIYVDNNYFTKVLSKSFKNKQVKLIHKKISINTIKELLKKFPLICYIDYHAFGDYSHYPHFIVIESESETKLNIIDPLFGKRQKISKNKLDIAIKELREHIKMCPILIQ